MILSLRSMSAQAIPSSPLISAICSPLGPVMNEDGLTDFSKNSVQWGVAASAVVDDEIYLDFALHGLAYDFCHVFDHLRILHARELQCLHLFRRFFDLHHVHLDDGGRFVSHPFGLFGLFGPGKRKVEHFPRIPRFFKYGKRFK
jgi:hypothetical protein